MNCCCGSIPCCSPWTPLPERTGGGVTVVVAFAGLYMRCSMNRSSSLHRRRKSSRNNKMSLGVFALGMDAAMRGSCTTLMGASKRYKLTLSSGAEMCSSITTGPSSPGAGRWAGTHSVRPSRTSKNTCCCDILTLFKKNIPHGRMIKNKH